MLEFVKKDSEGKEWNVRISSKLPYQSRKETDNVHCYIYRTLKFNGKKRKHWWSIFKTENHLETREIVLHQETTQLKYIADYTKDMFEGWAEQIVRQYEDYRKELDKEEKIRKIIGD